MIWLEEDILLLDQNPKDIIIQEKHKEGQTIIHIEVTADSPDSEAHPDPLPGCPELH